MTNLTDQTQYVDFVVSVKQRILQSQYEALKSVNKELIGLYWDIGKSIVEKQDAFGWGKSVVKTLAEDLQQVFVGIKGFSIRNLWNMRLFYLEYCNDSKLQPLVREISWTKNILILQKCKDVLQKEFYIQMTKRYGWTKNVLINHIENQSYEKFLLNQTNFDETIPKKYKDQVKLAVKDEYVFDFLELGEEHSERELETAIVKNIGKFLTQMGNDFTFMGNQYRLEVDGEEYFIDLLLFHRRLKSLIAVELKIGKFKPEYAGKMNFYLSALNDMVRIEDENPSIGIIICKDKNRTTVEYALRDSNKPIGVSSYQLLDKLPSDLQSFLPSSEEIAERLSIFNDKELDNNV